MNIKNHHFLFATALLLATIAIKQIVVPVIILVILSWVFNESFKKKRDKLKKNSLVLLLVLPFAAYLLGMIYSDNQAFGWKDIEVKLSLLLFPFIYGTTTFPLHKYKIQLAQVYVISSLIIGGISLIVGYLEYGQIPTYEMMDLFLHPGYLSMYMNLALLLVLWLNSKVSSRKSNLRLSLAFISLSAIIFLCLSKTGILIWLLILFSYAIYRFVIVKRQYLTFMLLMLFGGILMLSTYFTVPAVKERFYWGVSAFTSDKEVDQTTTESSRVRLLIWEQAIQLVKEKPLLGTGTGDIKDDLFVKYKQAGMTGALENKLNVHNQFLQVLATLGLISFLIFLLAMFYPPLKSLNQSHALYFGFVLIFAINLLAESMLEKQAGVIFYAFFNSLICFHFSKLESWRWSLK